MIPAQVTRMSSRPGQAPPPPRPRPRRLLARGDVAANGAAADRSGGLLRRGDVEVGDDDVRAPCREPCGRRRADAARPAGDEGDLAREPVRVASSVPPDHELGDADRLVAALALDRR